MNQNRVISTAVLFLLLGTTIPAFAQKGEEEKGGGGGKAQQAQHQQQPQHAEQAKQQPQHAQQAQHQQQPQHVEQAKQQPQHAQQAQHQQQPQQAKQEQHQQPQRAQQVQHQQQPQTVASNRGNNGNHYGRIPDDRYRSHFGHEHSFHMMRPQMIGGYNRFQYGGYWFGFNEGWPMGWDYNDDVYVVFVDGAYYLYDLRHPGIRITLNLF
jgi:hypothetical protein